MVCKVYEIDPRVAVLRRNWIGLVRVFPPILMQAGVDDLSDG